MQDNPFYHNCLILNASFEAIGTVSIQRSLTLILTGRAEYVESDETLEIRSPSIVFPLPVVIRLITFVKLPYTNIGLSRKSVFMRDGMRCTYCGTATETLTVDHVVPRSLGGEHKWTNVTTACITDNQRKGNKTLEELGWTLDPLPRQPSGVAWRVRGSQRNIDPRWEPYL